jgi:hypothetical protein
LLFFFGLQLLASAYSDLTLLQSWQFLHHYPVHFCALDRVEMSRIIRLGQFYTISTYTGHGLQARPVLAARTSKRINAMVSSPPPSIFQHGGLPSRTCRAALALDLLNPACRFSSNRLSRYSM